MPVAGHAQAVGFKFVIDRDAAYQVRFTSTEGEASGDSPEYTIRARPDLAPQVSLTVPGDDIALPPEGILKLEGSASDDHGLTGLTLRMKIKDGHTLAAKVYRGEEKKPGKPLFRFDDGTYPRQLEYREFVELASLTDERGLAYKLKPGQVVEYWLEAADNCDYPYPGPNVSRTERTYKVAITKPSAKPDPKKQEQDRKQAQQEQEKHKKEQDQKLKDENQKRNEQASPEDKARREEQRKEDLKKQAEELKKQLEKENKGNDKPNDKKDGAPDKGGEKGPGNQDKPDQKPGEGKNQGDKQPKPGDQGENKPGDKPDGGPKTPEGQKGQQKPNEGQGSNAEQGAGGAKKPSPTDQKDAGLDKPQGNKPDAGKAGADKGKGTGQAGEKGGEGKPKSDAKEVAGAGKGPQPKDGASAKPDPSAGPPEEGTVKGGEGKPMPQDGASANKQGNPPKDGNSPKAGGDPKGTQTAAADKPEEPKTTGTPNAGTTPRPQQDATMTDALQKQKALEGSGSDPDKRKEAVDDLKDMARNAKDPKVREAAKDALEKAGEKVPVSGDPRDGPNAEKPPSDPNISNAKPGPPEEAPDVKGKGTVPPDARMTGSDKPPDPNAPPSAVPPSGQPKGPAQGDKGTAGDTKQFGPDGMGTAPVPGGDGTTGTGSIFDGERDGRPEPTTTAQAAAQAADARNKLKAGDLQLQTFEKAFKDKKFLDKMKLTPEEAAEFLKNYKESLKNYREEVTRLEDMAKPGRLPDKAPTNPRPREIKPPSTSNPSGQGVGTLLPPAEFRETHRDFSDDISRLKLKRDAR